MLSGILFAFITPNEKKDDEENAEVFDYPSPSLINGIPLEDPSMPLFLLPKDIPLSDPEESDWSIATWSTTQKRVVGVVLSLISGLLYGFAKPNSFPHWKAFSNDFSSVPILLLHNTSLIIVITHVHKMD